jgi:hypothetical protein
MKTDQHFRSDTHLPILPVQSPTHLLESQVPKNFHHPLGITAIIRPTRMAVPWDDTRPLAAQEISRTKPIAIDEMNRIPPRYTKRISIALTPHTQFFSVRYECGFLWITPLSSICVTRSVLNSAMVEDNFETVGFTAELQCQGNGERSGLALVLLPKLRPPCYGLPDQSMLAQLNRIDTISKFMENELNQGQLPQAYCLSYAESGLCLRRQTAVVKPDIVRPFMERPRRRTLRRALAASHPFDGVKTILRRPQNTQVIAASDQLDVANDSSGGSMAIATAIAAKRSPEGTTYA